MRSKAVNLPGNAQAGAHKYEYDNAGRLKSWGNPAEQLSVYILDLEVTRVLRVG